MAHHFKMFTIKKENKKKKNNKIVNYSIINMFQATKSSIIYKYAP